MFMRFEKLPTIRSYDRALAFYNKTKPNRNNGRIPLRRDRRNSDTVYIKLNNDGSLSCVLYSTPVVTYYPDGRVHVDTSYNSRSTNDFAASLAPYDCSFYMERSKPIVAVQADDGEYLRFVCPREGLTLRTRGAVAVTALPEDNSAMAKLHVRHIKRGHPHKVSKLLSGIADYAKTMASLGPVSHETVAEIIDAAEQAGFGFMARRDPTMEMIADSATWPWIASAFYLNRYTVNVQGQRGYMSQLDVGAMLSHLRLSAYEWLDSYEYAPLAFGTLPRDLDKLVRLD